MLIVANMHTCAIGESAGTPGSTAAFETGDSQYARRFKVLADHLAAPQLGQRLLVGLRTQPRRP